MPSDLVVVCAPYRGKTGTRTGKRVGGVGRQQREPIIVDIPAAGDKMPWWGAPLGIAVAVLAFALAWAFWQMAQAVSIAILLLGLGASARQVLVGVAYWRAAELAGRARVIEAEGQARAQITSAEAAGIAAIRQARLGDGW